MNCCKPFIPVEKRKPQNLLPPIDGGRLGWGWTYELFPPHLHPPPPGGRKQKKVIFYFFKELN